MTLLSMLDRFEQAARAAKPLVWELVDDDWWAATAAGFLTYEVRQARASVRVRTPEAPQFHVFEGNIDAAKAAAQADCDTRILSALDADRDELHAARRAIMEAFEEARRADIVPATITDKDGNKRDAFVDRARGIVLEPAPTIVEAELVKALKEANAFILAPAEDLKDGVLSRLRAAIRSAELEVYGRDEHGRELKRPAGLGGVLSEALALLHPSLEQE